MAKEKSKSLLNKTTSKPKKKLDKYSEEYIEKREYKYKPNDKVVYFGSMNGCHGLECTIIKRRRRKNLEYYKIQFNNDDEIISDISGNFLKSLEEYEQWVSNQENEGSEEENKNKMSEFELELNRQGKTSYQNYDACLSPLNYYQMSCTECRFCDRCVYKNKGDYKKLKFN